MCATIGTGLATARINKIDPLSKNVNQNATNNQGQPVSAEVYFYIMEAGDFRQTKKMILLKQNYFYALSPTFVGFFVCGMMGKNSIS